MKHKQIVKAIEGADRRTVAKLNRKLISGGLVIVDSSYYSDPDAFTNKFEIWAKAFMALTGFTDYQWFWHGKRAGMTTMSMALKDGKDRVGDSNDGNWTIVFSGGPFENDSPLGSLVFVADDSNMGYVLNKFSLSKDYHGAVVSIPSSVKRGKDIAQLIQRQFPLWVGGHIALYGRSLQRCLDIFWKDGKLQFVFRLDSTRQAVQLGESEPARLAKEMGFTDIEVKKLPFPYNDVVLTATPPKMKLLQSPDWPEEILRTKF